MFKELYLIGINLPDNISPTDINSETPLSVVFTDNKESIIIFDMTSEEIKDIKIGQKFTFSLHISN